jgi:hypothetical protein
MEVPSKIGKGLDLTEGQKVVVYPITSAYSFFMARGKIATLAVVTHAVEKSGTPMVELRGERRVRILSRKKFAWTKIAEIEPALCENIEDRGERLRKKAQQFVFLININESDRLIYLMNFIHGTGDISDFIAHYFVIDNGKKSRLFREIDTCVRSELLEKYLDEMIMKLTETRSGETDEKRHHR